MRVGPLEHRSFRGNVSAGFTDGAAMLGACKTPIYFHDLNRAPVCTARKWSSVCDYNFDNYMESWTDHAKNGSPENDRLPIFALLDGNVNATTAWLDVSNVTWDSENSSVLASLKTAFHISASLKLTTSVNNVTIAIPRTEEFLQRLVILIMD
jgi:hypothetical protein